MQKYADLYTVPHSHACAQMHTCAHSHTHRYVHKLTETSMCMCIHTRARMCASPLGTESLYPSEQGTSRGGLLIGSRFTTKV